MADWTILSLLQTTTRWFQGQGITTPRLDAEVLLAHHLGVDRLHLYMYADKPLTSTEVDGYRALVRRRGQREPVAYITGQKAFHDVELVVGPGVLVPRPETEMLVDRALELIAGRPAGEPALLLDLCTGSGAIPLAILKASAAVRALGVDISADALAFTRMNAEKLGLSERLGVVRSDGLQAVPPRFRGLVDLLTCNPPYLTDAEMASLSPEVRHEPTLALAGGRDGADFYRRLAVEALPWMRPGGQLLLEIGHGQGPLVGKALQDAGWRDPEIHLDLAKLERMVTATAPG